MFSITVDDAAVHAAFTALAGRAINTQDAPLGNEGRGLKHSGVREGRIPDSMRPSVTRGEDRICPIPKTSRGATPY